MILMMWLPFTPPPAKDVMAYQQRPPAFKPADPFDDIVIMTPKQMKRAAEATLPKLKSVRGY
jgi:hypothetical protein